MAPPNAHAVIRTDLDFSQDECRQLADKAAQLTETFQEQASLLQESQLREHADMIEAYVRSLHAEYSDQDQSFFRALAKVNSRTNRWASYSYIHAFRTHSVFWSSDEGTHLCASPRF